MSGIRVNTMPGGGGPGKGGTKFGGSFGKVPDTKAVMSKAKKDLTAAKSQSASVTSVKATDFSCCFTSKQGCCR